MNIVIVGSGPAGIFAAEAIRNRDRESSIIMVTADQGVAHSPVMLSYWIAGNRPRESLFFRNRSWVEKMGVDVRSGCRASSLNTFSQQLMLAEGDEILYERLLIATGSKPMTLPLPGMKSKGIYCLRNLNDAEAILQDSGGIREVVVIGGGFIGLKLTCHLKERGLEVTVLEKESKLAARLFDRRTSRIIERRLCQNGIQVETDVEIIEAFNEDGWVTGVGMKDGRILRCQRVFQTVGVMPNVQWLEGSGILIKGGILVNDHMETNVEGVYAAGDAVMTIDSVISEWVNNATWPAATRQGIVAGTNMAEGDCTYVHNYALNALNLFGLKVITAGHSYYEEDSGAEIVWEEDHDRYRKIVIKEGRLIGFILVGDVTGAGLLLSLMKRKEEIPQALRHLLLSGSSLYRNLPVNLGFRHGFIFGKGVQA